MIYPQTMLTVADNTGARKIMCIRVLGGNRKYAKVGDTIIGVVKEALPNMPIKRSDVVRAVIVRTCKTIRRQDDQWHGAVCCFQPWTVRRSRQSLQAEFAGKAGRSSLGDGSAGGGCGGPGHDYERSSVWAVVRVHHLGDERPQG